MHPTASCAIPSLDDGFYLRLESNKFSVIMCLFALTASIKLLLVPAYFSTDLLVHRHWKALTRELRVSDWYYDDRHISTKHTLDYPPGFAWFEYFWSAYFYPLWKIAAAAMNKSPETTFSVYGECLDLQDDSQVFVSEPCLLLMRSTVILSDMVYWLGAWCAARFAVVENAGGASENELPQGCQHDGIHQKNWNIQVKHSWTAFLLLVFHPALLWLDHVHFQYNGFLFGVLLLSLACLLQAQKLQPDHKSSSKSESQAATFEWFAYHSHTLGGAVLFALLLTLKHLYLTLSLWYFCYLWKSYCCYDGSIQKSWVADTSTTTKVKQIELSAQTSTAQGLKEAKLFKDSTRFSLSRFLFLGVLTLLTLSAPCVPLLIDHAKKNIDSFSKNGDDSSHSILDLLNQIGSRLFPFKRGLVHDYWAANIWALHAACSKVLDLVAQGTSSSLPTPQPGHVAIMLLLVLIPGGAYAWRAARLSSTTLMLLSLTYTAFASFQFGYHVHEKAIVTTLLPLTLLVVVVRSREEEQDLRIDQVATGESTIPQIRRNYSSGSADDLSVILWRTTAWAVLGLFPLLFPSTELLLKWTSYGAYLSTLWLWCDTSPEAAGLPSSPSILSKGYSILADQKWPVAVICIATIMLQTLPLYMFGRLQFLPLAWTSCACAVGLLFEFFRLSRIMITSRI